MRLTLVKRCEAQSLVHLGMRGTQAEFSLEFEPEARMI